MNLLYHILLTYFLAFSAPALAQSDSATSQNIALPGCAVICTVNAFSQGLCTPDDVVCMCTNQEFQQQVTACVVRSCPVIDQLGTKNATFAACGVPLRSRGQSLRTLSIVVGSIALVFVLARFGFKLTMGRAQFGLDDICLLLTALVAGPGIAVTVTKHIPNGLGSDWWSLTAHQITDFLYWFWVACWLYYLQIALMKLSLLFFFMRIFPARRTRNLLWLTVVFTFLQGVAFVLCGIIQCRPISFFWHQWKEEGGGWCMNGSALTWSSAILNIAQDVWMLAIPLNEVRKLQLHWKKKIGVGLMFIVGTFITVISLLRIHTLVHFTKTDNPTQDTYDVSFWSTLEIGIGVICVCMPTVRLLLVKVFPILKSPSTQRSYMYPSTAVRRHGLRNQEAETSKIVSAGSTIDTIGTKDDMMQQTSYEVLIQKNDYIRLKSLPPPPPPVAAARSVESTAYRIRAFTNSHPP